LITGGILGNTERFRDLICFSSDKCDKEIDYKSTITSFGLIPIGLDL
jgi:hypothetical protein